MSGLESRKPYRISLDITVKEFTQDIEKHVKYAQYGYEFEIYKTPKKHENDMIGWLLNDGETVLISFGNTQKKHTFMIPMITGPEKHLENRAAKELQTKTAEKIRRILREGTSPRTRGKLADCSLSQTISRNIPAHAGKT